MWAVLSVGSGIRGAGLMSMNLGLLECLLRILKLLFAFLLFCKERKSENYLTNSTEKNKISETKA